LGKEGALAAFDSALAEYGLAVQPDTTGEVSGELAPEAYPDSGVVNDYYYNEGPPVVTYYLPPADYAYLYSWVPYPFWGWNTWYPGFYVLADFNVRVKGHGHRHGHRFDHGEFISNHFRDRDTGRIHRIDPAKRSYHGHREVRSGDRGERVWNSPSGRRGSEAIFNRSLGKGHPRSQNIVPERSNRSIVAPSGSGSRISPASRPAASSPVPAVRRGGQFDGSGYRGGEHFNRPAFREPSAGSRAFSPPSNSGRTYSSPPAGGRGISGWSERGSFGRGDGGSHGGGRRR
jgi:hypothetical protein